jgi:hypothetical protein
MRFLSRIVLTAVAFAAGAVALRRWLDEQNAALVGAPASPSATQSPESSNSSSSSSSNSNHTGPVYDSLTKEELYQRAQVAGVKGRSKMSKTELAEAVARAELGGG